MTLPSPLMPRLTWIMVHIKYLSRTEDKPTTMYFRCVNICQAWSESSLSAWTKIMPSKRLFNEPRATTLIRLGRSELCGKKQQQKNKNGDFYSMLLLVLRWSSKRFNDFFYKIIFEASGGKFYLLTRHILYHGMEWSKLLGRVFWSQIASHLRSGYVLSVLNEENQIYCCYNSAKWTRPIYCSLGWNHIQCKVIW